MNDLATLVEQAVRDHIERHPNGWTERTAALVATGAMYSHCPQPSDEQRLTAAMAGKLAVFRQQGYGPQTYELGAHVRAIIDADEVYEAHAPKPGSLIVQPRPYPTLVDHLVTAAIVLIVATVIGVTLWRAYHG